MSNHVEPFVSPDKLLRMGEPEAIIMELNESSKQSDDNESRNHSIQASG